MVTIPELIKSSNASTSGGLPHNLRCFCGFNHKLVQSLGGNTKFSDFVRTNATGCKRSLAEVGDTAKPFKLPFVRLLVASDVSRSLRMVFPQRSMQRAACPVGSATGRGVWGSFWSGA